MTKHGKVIELVSNIPSQTTNQDNLLQNPWGTVIHGDSVWVADNNTNVLTNYDFKGRKLTPGTVNLPQGDADIPQRPTGIALNQTRGFVIQESDNNKAASLLIIVGENGIIWGYNPLVDQDNAFIAVDFSAEPDHPVYKGCAIAGNYLYAADFHNGQIDVFDFNFNQVTTLNFTDPSENQIPEDYAPFNIVNIRNKLYVTYAKRLAPNNVDDESGPGNGYINVFDTNGNFIRRFASGEPLNSPWGITLSPFSDSTVMVANKGDGKINVFSTHGDYKGALKSSHHDTLVIEGLLSLSRHHKCIYYSAGPNMETDGIVGKIKFIR